MLIKDVVYNYSLKGSVTSLTMTNPDAYTLQAQQDVLDKRANKIGVNI